MRKVGTFGVVVGLSLMGVALLYSIAPRKKFYLLESCNSDGCVINDSCSDCVNKMDCKC